MVDTHYDIHIRVYITARAHDYIPTQREAENRIADLLLAMPRLEEGADWHVHATSLPEQPVLEERKRHGKCDLK